MLVPCTTYYIFPKKNVFHWSDLFWIDWLSVLVKMYWKSSFHFHLPKLPVWPCQTSFCKRHSKDVNISISKTSILRLIGSLIVVNSALEIVIASKQYFSLLWCIVYLIRSSKVSTPSMSNCIQRVESLSITFYWKSNLCRHKCISSQKPPAIQLLADTCSRVLSKSNLCFIGFK